MLAKLGAPKSDTGDVIFWCVIFIFALVAMLVAGIWIRRRFLADADSASTGDVLTLQQLRELRRSGQITEGEFQTLKSQIIAQFNPTSNGDSD